MPEIDAAGSVREQTATPITHAYTRTSEEVLRTLNADPSGLSEEEIAVRRERYGPNALPEPEPRTIWAMVLDQFRDFLILLLLGAGIIAGALGEIADTVAIFVIVVLNAVIGVVQEYRAERAIESLREMAKITATVRRAGGTAEIAAHDLVPGDVVLLDAGRVVPADLRLIEAAHLRIAEAALTGESEPVDKTTEALPAAEIPLGDRRNMAYRGTHVVYGRGVGVVTATGSSTQLGMIAGLLATTEDVKTPLQKRLAQFGRQLGVAAIGLSGLVFVIGLMRGEDLLAMFLTAVSLAVAAVPEALPAVATITLALGARKLVKTNALVRRLPAVETLGSVTYICTDKTGTLTMNRMSAESFSVDGKVSGVLPKREDTEPGSLASWLGMAMAISNDVAGGPDPSDLTGDPTEIALYRAAEESGFRAHEVAEELPRVAELPFDSDRKLMTTVHRSEGRHVSFTKGAAEAVLDRARRSLSEDGRETDLDRERIEAIVDAWSNEGLRVLAFGMRSLDAAPAESDLPSVEQDLVFLGLVALLDPPRPEAAEAVQTCIEAGITPVMITGDHPATALAIAKRLDISDSADEMLTGAQLEALDEKHFERRVADLRVYARVAPEQKLKIVKALQDRGEFVSMTGDGVNDAPALARADIGVAMGITGTDVAKEAASMVLLDDNFASIVGAVREGRHIFDNIRKFIKYTMTSNSGEIWTLLLAPFLGLPIPLLPIHILWINLVTDGLPGLAFAAEPAEKGIMKRPPRPPKESIFAEGLAVHLVWVGLLMGGVSLLSQGVAISLGDENWQTIVFTVLCFSQLGHALAIRSDKESLFRQGLLTNLPLAGAVALTLVLQLAVIYVPLLQPVFRTQALTPLELAATLAASTVVFWAVEIEKRWKRAATGGRTAKAA